jgi:hypothetical protein
MQLAKPGLPFSEIVPRMRTFDLIMFRGGDKVSDAISGVESMVVGSGEFTHVGLVVRGDSLMPHARANEAEWLTPDGVYLFESTKSGKMTDGVGDVHGHSHLGVQIRDLSKVVHAYDAADPDTRMAWLPLGPAARSRAPASFREPYEKYRGLMYDASAVDLAAAAGVPGARELRDCCLFSRLRSACYRTACCFLCAGGVKRADYSPTSNKKDNTPSKWQFCSELAANILRDVPGGLFPASIEPENVMPMDLLTCVPNFFGELVRFHAP